MQIIDATRKMAIIGAENDLHRRQPRQTASQIRVVGKESDFFGLPVDNTKWFQLQDLTPGSPTLGQFLF